jgi:hypothetical protein
MKKNKLQQRIAAAKAVPARLDKDRASILMQIFFPLLLMPKVGAEQRKKDHDKLSLAYFFPRESSKKSTSGD